jgi:YggT family protein
MSPADFYEPFRRRATVGATPRGSAGRPAGEPVLRGGRAAVRVARPFRGKRRRTMLSVIRVVDLILELYSYVLLAYVILSLLIAFGVVNYYNRFVNGLFEVLQKLTEPLLKPIRRLLPDTGALDLSPLILFLLIYLLRSLLAEYGPRLAM